MVGIVNNKGRILEIRFAIILLYIQAIYFNHCFIIWLIMGFN